MSAHIDSAFYNYLSLVPDPQQGQLTEIHESIDRTQLPVSSLIPVTDINLHTRDYSAWPPDSYEYGCCYRNSRTEEELPDVEALSKRIRGLKAKITRLRKQEGREADVEELESELKGWDDALDEPSYDEIYWNYVWRPRDELDEDLARSLGFGILHVTRDFPGCRANDAYMGLQGCGMDLTPMLVAYCALKYRLVDREWVHYFRTADDWTCVEHVVGPQCAKIVLVALGVPRPTGG